VWSNVWRLNACDRCLMMAYPLVEGVGRRDNCLRLTAYNKAPAFVCLSSWVLFVFPYTAWEKTGGGGTHR
jgi:hypothetical protein